MNVGEIQRFHYLYERVSADLARLATFTSERDTRTFLESLVARAYGEIHEIREKPHRFRPIRWFLRTFPQTFRRHLWAFNLSAAITLAGILIGGLLLACDPSSKEALLPGFDDLMQSPSERVAQEENVLHDHLKGRKAQGAAWYMTHNAGVAIQTLALGITWGIGTVIMLFSTGIMIGAIAVEYILAGQTAFLVGWLLPHGSVEIPAILLAGQAAFVLAGALIGWGKKVTLRERFRRISSDLVTLIFGVAVLLVWAGAVEAYVSQYHKPALPYSLKIAFGCVELVLLTIFLACSGRSAERPAARPGAETAAAPGARS
jgi:uncharacterized membrane protein SpoIIM required for sporulation